MTLSHCCVWEKRKSCVWKFMKYFSYAQKALENTELGVCMPYWYRIEPMSSIWVAFWTGNVHKCQQMPAYVGVWIAHCVWPAYEWKFHTHLLRFSHTQQCDRAINLVCFDSPVIIVRPIATFEGNLLHHLIFSYDAWCSFDTPSLGFLCNSVYNIWRICWWLYVSQILVVFCNFLKKKFVKPVFLTGL